MAFLDSVFYDSLSPISSVVSICPSVYPTPILLPHLTSSSLSPFQALRLCSYATPAHIHAHTHYKLGLTYEGEPIVFVFSHNFVITYQVMQELLITNYHNFHVSSKLGNALTHLIGQNAREQNKPLMAEKKPKNISDSLFQPTWPGSFYIFRSAVSSPVP